MLLLLFAVVATCFNEGIWSNAGASDQRHHRGAFGDQLLEPLARALDGWQPSYTYLWDFLSLWGLFGVFLLVFREIDRPRFAGERPLSETRRPHRQRGAVDLDRLGDGLLYDDDAAHGAAGPQLPLRGVFDGHARANVVWYGPARPGLAGIHAEDVDRRVRRSARSSTRTPSSCPSTPPDARDLEKNISGKDSLLVGP